MSSITLSFILQDEEEEEFDLEGLIEPPEKNVDCTEKANSGDKRYSETLASLKKYERKDDVVLSKEEMMFKDSFTPRFGTPRFPRAA